MEKFKFKVYVEFALRTILVMVTCKYIIYKPVDNNCCENRRRRSRGGTR